MHRIILLFVFILYFSGLANSQDSINKDNHIPLTKFFYKFDKDLAGSFTYHYGLNYIAAGVATLLLIGGDNTPTVDWDWYRYTYTHRAIYNAGYSAYYVGWTVPFAAPVGLYLYGLAKDNPDLQAVSMALAQSAFIGWSISAALKIITGRVQPIYLSDPDNLNGDFRFGFLRGGINNGWPSTHSTVAFAMATTLFELYPDNQFVRIGAMVYASYIAIGVSCNVHWASDCVAGALIGYAIGRTIGINYRNLMSQSNKKQAYNFYMTPTGAVLNYQF